MSHPSREIVLNETRYETAHAIFYYLYNRSALGIVLDVFRAEERGLDSLHPSYVEEKLRKLAKSPATFYGYLDEENSKRFVDLAVKFFHGEVATSNARVAEYAEVLFAKKGEE